jgi:hypothetical protein
MARLVRPVEHAVPFHPNGRDFRWKMRPRLIVSRLPLSMTSRDECGVTAIAARPFWGTSVSRRRARSTPCGRTFAKLVCQEMTPAKRHDGASICEGNGCDGKSRDRPDWPISLSDRSSCTRVPDQCLRVITRPDRRLRAYPLPPGADINAQGLHPELATLVR